MGYDTEKSRNMQLHTQAFQDITAAQERMHSNSAFGVQTSCHCMQINQLKQTHHAAAAGDAHAAIMRPPRSAGAPSFLQAAI